MALIGNIGYNIVMRSPSRSYAIYTIAVIGFIFTLHTVIPMYSNSSFLGLFASAEMLGMIYMMSAAVSILGYLVAPSIIRRIGNYRIALILICLQIFLFDGLIVSSSPVALTIFFVLQSAVVALIGLCLDIFLEVNTDAGNVGRIRGFYTATLNASWLVGPLIGTLLINGGENYRNTYVAGLAMLFPLLYLVFRNFPRFVDPNYIHLSPHHLLIHISHNKNWVRLISANLILQTFYSWMVVYSPIYLHKIMGFNWDEIGIILVVMLLPFPLFQYYLGRLADTKYGEKEIMAIGFLIMGLATVMLAFVSVKSVLVWAVMLFVTRVGAAAAEIMMEIYFFKTVSARDSAVLGSFRITRPLSLFLAPAIMLIGSYFLDFRYMFIVIGLVTLLALYPVLLIKDTR